MKSYRLFLASSDDNNLFSSITFRPKIQQKEIFFKKPVKGKVLQASASKMFMQKSISKKCYLVL